jgi:hypothetical protein
METNVHVVNKYKQLTQLYSSNLQHHVSTLKDHHQAKYFNKTHKKL